MVGGAWESMVGGTGGDYLKMAGPLMWISLGWISGPGDGPRHGMRPLSSQNLIRPYPLGIVVARGLIRPYPFFLCCVFFFNRKQYLTLGSKLGVLSNKLCTH